MTKYWNFDKNRCKLVREYAEAGFINKRLDKYENIVKDIINGYGIVTPTQATLKADFTNYKDRTNINAGGISQVEQQQYFVPFVLEYIKDCDRKRNTVKHYHTTINKLLEYERQFILSYVFSILILRFITLLKSGYYPKLSAIVINITPKIM